MNKLTIHKITTIDEVINIYKSFLSLNIEDKIIFDFKDSKFIYSNYTSFLGALIDNCKQFDIILPDKEKVLTVLQKNNFFPSYTDVARLNDTSNSVIAFDRFAIEDTAKQNNFFESLLDNKLLKSKGLTNVSDKVLNEVSKNIIELFDNSREHSNSKVIYIAGQFFPQKHKLDFTIVDTGIGIKTNVNNFLDEDYSSSKAINWAMQKRNTTRVDEPGGLGLGLLKELIIKTSGKLEVISNSGYYFIKNKVEDYKEIDIDFKGTLINIEFNITDTKYYLKEEISSENNSKQNYK